MIKNSKWHTFNYELNIKNFIGDGDNLFDIIKSAYDSWMDMLSALTLFQLGSLAHLLSAVFILMCLFNVIVIIYSDMLLIYFKLEEKYPKLQIFFKYKQKFQKYNLGFNLLILFGVCIYTIGIDLILFGIAIF